MNQIESALIYGQCGHKYKGYIEALCNLESPDIVGTAFSDYTLEQINKVFKRKKVRSLPDRPTWYDNECRQKRNELLEISRKKSSELSHKLMLHIKTKEYNAMKQSKKRNFASQCCQKIELAYINDKSSMWKVINGFTRECSTNNMPTCDQFYDHFRNKSLQKSNERFDYNYENEAIQFLDTNQQVNPINWHYDIDFEILNKDFDEHEVLNAISKLKNGKSPGPDGIIPEFIKNAKSVFSSNLTQMFNYFIEHRLFPASWAEGLRNPIFKAGDSFNCSNYRGITVLSMFEKIFEIVILNRLEFISESFQKKDRYNTGFSKGSRTCDNNFVIMGLVQRQLSLGRPLIVVHVDFSQAFDLVNRNILFYKLKKSGYKGRVVDTLLDLYRKTSFRVKVNGKLSTMIFQMGNNRSFHSRNVISASRSL